MENRVYCLYRVSTDKQVDYDNKNQADLPMQRKACHRFADEKSWTIIHEEQEEGVSGHKIRAERRDKLQIIKEHAKQGKFDILLVFMFDRIGRIADETPFVVEWFVKNGIRVWSTQEGEQRFDNHTDKLTNYIRFWQADGESEKTSIRTRTSLGQLVEDGHYKGGNAAYGYDLVKSGRLNKKKHELYDLVVNVDEAAVVRIIFDKYVSEGFGTQRIATYLNGCGYTMHILDDIIEKVVHGIFERMRNIQKSEIVNVRYREKMNERKSLLHTTRADYTKAASDLEALKSEIIKSIKGESAFSKDMLASLITEAEAKCTELQRLYEKSQADYDEGQAVLAELNTQYDEIITWSEMYDTAGFEAKKMIVNCLISRVEVYRGYKLHIDFKIDLDQFSSGLDIAA